MESGTKVYILGAGCSAAFGYPLGNGFVKALDAFGKTLSAPDKQQIKRAVESTVHLLQSNAVATLDELVDRINRGLFDEPARSFVEKDRLRYDRIHDAKVATLALFHSLEAAASKSGLLSYTHFLREIFPDRGSWQCLLANSHCRVLSFNYDRLFEMAFQQLFGPDTGQFALYGGAVLNSGLNVIQKRTIDFEPNRFSFLKLHGSIGMTARNEHGDPCHYHNSHGPVSCVPQKELVDDDFFPRLANPYDRRSEPLIVFPDEKDFVRSAGKNGFPYREYITKVWDHAEKLVSQAAEIWVIGYSFSPIDRPSFMRLVSAAKSCKKIVVQNPEAKNLCNGLQRKFPELRVPLDPYEAIF